MHPSTPSATSETSEAGPLTLLYWLAAMIGCVPTVLFATFLVYGAIAAWLNSGPPLSAISAPYALLGLIVVGLLVATFWPGVGEVGGGLALLSGAYWVIASNPWVWWATSSAAVLYAVAGVLFIVCSWDALARWRASPTRTLACASGSSP